jgi:hypothetical protein
MLSSQKIAEKQISSFGTEIDLVDSDLGNSKLGIGIIMMLASFVGVWGTICLMNGLIQANSFQQLGRGLFTAITGL